MLMGNPEATPAPAGDVGGGQGTPAPSSSNWLEGADPETSGWATKKGWQSPLDALKSHRELERMLGGEKVPVPKDANDKAAWDLFYKAAGRPEAPEGYGLDKIEGLDPELSAAAQAEFHKFGLSSQQGQELAKWWASNEAQKATKDAEQFAIKSSAELADLQKAWGSGFEPKAEAAKRAAKQFGFDAETLSKMERAIGTKGLIEKLSAIGEAMSEAPLRGVGNESESAIVTKDAAEAKIKMLKQDRDWVRRWNDGGAKERAELDRLQRIAVS